MTDLSDQALGLLAEVTRRQLIHLLESLPGSKDLIVEDTLLRPLDRVASMSLLRNHGCLRVHPLRYGSNVPTIPSNTRIVFILRPSFEMAQLLANYVRSVQETEISVIWVHRKSAVCERELELQGVFGMIQSFELNMCLVPLEGDLFSLELPVSQKPDLFVAANSIFQLQSLYGLIPTIYGLGEQSEKMWKLVRLFYSEHGEPRASPDQPISHLFIFDRSLDLASVMLTGLTYESMLHDVFNIGCGKISFGSDVEDRIKSDGAESDGARKSRIYTLDNNDGVFASVRNKHMIGVFPFLSTKAKEIQSTFDRGASIDQIQDMKKFVSSELKHLKAQHRQLEMHICACEVLLERNATTGSAERLKYEHGLLSGSVNLSEIMSYVEDCMLREYSPWSILSLVCLASMIQNGLPNKFYVNFREHFLRAYGYEYLPVLHCLAMKRLLFEKAKSIGPTVNMTKFTSIMGPSSDSLPSIPFLNKRMNLIPSAEEPSTDLRNPSKMSYVFSGAFTPPLCQVVSDSIIHGWNTNEQKKTFGHVFVEENSYTPADCKPDNRMRKAILVFFLGGVTYAEVAALRLLAVQNNFRVLIAATNIVQRDVFLKCMGEVDTKPLE